MDCIREVLDCASPLALWNNPGPVESARGLAQSKTLSRSRVQQENFSREDL
jgi:hypothetical protein